MEFEMLWNQLMLKYGEEFPWSRVEPGGTDFVQEACREIQENHPLYGKPLTALAQCHANDDVLFAVDDAYAVIHLTWSPHNQGDFPKFHLFNHMGDILSYLERAYIEEYL